MFNLNFFLLKLLSIQLLAAMIQRSFYPYIVLIICSWNNYLIFQVLKHLEPNFPPTVNDKGFKVLPDYIRIFQVQKAQWFDLQILQQQSRFYLSSIYNNNNICSFLSFMLLSLYFAKLIMSWLFFEFPMQAKFFSTSKIFYNTKSLEWALNNTQVSTQFSLGRALIKFNFVKFWILFIWTKMYNGDWFNQIFFLVTLFQGDGISYETLTEICEAMKKEKWSLVTLLLKLPMC